MRLGTMSIIASSLLGMAGIALAQSDGDEAPLPPAPSQPLPASETAPRMGPAMPAWQAPPGGGYGGWNAYGYGDDGHGHGECCSSGGCGSCCHKCRPGLWCRLKALKCKICARRACRRCSRSSCCSSCCGDGMIDHEMPADMHHSDLLPTPPAEAAPYGGDEENSMQDDSANRPTAAAAPVARRQYTMPRVTSARKAVTRTNYRR